MKRSILVKALLSLAANATIAAEPNQAMQAFLKETILPWAQEDVLIGAIAARNVEYARLNADEIREMDETWIARVGTSGSTLVDGVLNNSAAEFLRAQMAASGGAMTETFVMDSNGLNVAATGPTSDYWQGEEAKFQQTFSIGADAVHFSEIEFDESSQSYQVQISLTLTDPATGEPIGAMTVGVGAEAIM